MKITSDDVLLRQAARVAWGIFSGNRAGFTSRLDRMAGASGFGDSIIAGYSLS
jgi:hypothetical protein